MSYEFHSAQIHIYYGWREFETVSTHMELSKLNKTYNIESL